MEERRDMAQEAWRAYLELALGATEATRKKATKTVKRLAGKSAVSAEQLQSMVEDVLRTSSTNREALTKLVRYELERALGAVGLATAEEVGALTARVRELETRQRAAAPEHLAPVKVAKKAVKKAVPGPIYDAGEPLAGTGDVELGASEPAVPPVVKKTVARKRVANTTVSNASATTAAVADAAAGPAKSPAKVAKAVAAKTAPPTRRAPNKTAPSRAAKKAAS
jgi:polyhydroxyalkanoate synthesis regulator phasin